MIQEEKKKRALEITKHKRATLELELTALVKDAMTSGDWGRIVSDLMEREDKKQREEELNKTRSDQIEMEMEEAVKHAIVSGDWGRIIYHLCERREPAKCVRRFIIKALRGEIPRPTHGIRTEAKEEEETYVAYLALYLADSTPR